MMPNMDTFMNTCNNMCNNAYSNISTPVLFRCFTRCSDETIEDDLILSLKEVRDNLPLLNKKMNRMINILYFSPEELDTWFVHNTGVIYIIEKIAEDVHKYKLYLNSNECVNSDKMRTQFSNLINNYEYIYFYSQLYKIIELYENSNK